MADDQGQQYQDQLSQLFANLQNPLAQNPGGPAPPLLAAGNPVSAPYSPPGTALPAGRASRPAPPSDDPAIAMPALPSAPSFQDQLAARQAARAKVTDINAAHANDRTNNQPHWYDRLLGGATGALVGGLTGNAKQGATVGGRITNRAEISADRQKQTELAPFMSQLDAEKEDEPFYKASNENTQHGFEDARQLAQEKREQLDSTARIEDYRAQAKQRSAKAEEGPKEPKNADEALSAASAATDPNEKARLLKLSEDLHKQEIDRVKSGRQPREPKDTAAADTERAIKVAEHRRSEHDKVDKSQETEKEKRYKELDSDITLKYDHDKLKAAKDAVDQELETRYAPKHKAIDEESDKMLGLTKSGAALKSESEPNAPSGSTKPPKPGTKLTDQAVAKSYLQKAGGDKTKARTLAQADGWKF